MKSTLPGAAKDCVVVRQCLVEPGGQRLLHADGGASTTDVARQGQQFFDVNHFHFLVARHFGGFLEVHLLGAGDDAYEKPCLVATQHQRLEQPFYGLSQLFGDMGGAEVVFVHLVGDELVGNLHLVEHPRCVGLLGFIGHIKLFLDNIYEIFGQDDVLHVDGFGEEWEVISVEDKFVIDYHGYKISGIADLVLRHKDTGAIRVIDHKTKSQASLSKEMNLYRKQLYLYAYWCKERFGEYPQDVCFNMIKTQELIVEPFSEDAMNSAMQWFIDTIHKIEQSDLMEDWPCKINKFFCSNICDVCTNCTEWLEVKQVDYQKWLAKKQAEEEMYAST